MFSLVNGKYSVLIGQQTIQCFHWRQQIIQSSHWSIVNIVFLFVNENTVFSLVNEIFRILIGQQLIQFSHWSIEDTVFILVNDSG